MKLQKKIMLSLLLMMLFVLCMAGESYRRGYFEGDGKNTNEAVVSSSEFFEDETNQNNTESDKRNQNETDAITIEKLSSDDKKVKVVLSTTNFTGLYHKEVSLTSEEDFIVTVDGIKTKYSAGEKVHFQKKDRSLKGKSISVSSAKGRMQVLSITRQNISPAYRGKLQVKWKKQGLLLINHINVEEYLYAVVPSELSTGNEMEALKAQAVCARTYIYNQMKNSRFQAYHADVDDSVDCQVYNNVPEDARSRVAVKETEGKVMTSEDNLIVAYYFSTSWGYTADGQSVWDTENAISYLKSSSQAVPVVDKKKETKDEDLSTDAAFQKFIAEDTEKTFDSGKEWYRWSVTLSAKKIAARINSALMQCHTSNPANILILQKNGSYQEGNFKTIGKIMKMQVEKREKSGLVSELVLTGTKGSVKVCNQYHIRKVLAPLYETIYRKGAESVDGYTMLPSAAFYIETVSTKKGRCFKLIGGGFGHGSGMSQEGAATMAELGYDYQKILKHYYKGIQIQDVSKLL